MDEKGQSLTVEQMFLFTIGLLITVSIFIAFRVISGHVTTLAEDDQLEEVGSLVLSGIQRVAKELPYNDRAELVIDIPQDISRSEYTVLADGSTLTISLTSRNRSATMRMEGVENAYLVTGRVTSATGKLRIEGVRADKSIRLLREVT